MLLGVDCMGNYLCGAMDSIGSVALVSSVSGMLLFPATT